MRASERAKRNYWIELGVVIGVAALLIASFIYSSIRPLDAHDLAIEVSDLRTLSAGAAQLANEHASGNTTDVFFDNQLELMHDKATSTRDSLESSEAEPEIQENFAEAKRLADRVAAAFERLGVGDSDARGELSRLGLSLKSLEEHLKEEAEK
jgi:hypothetical protein